MGLKDFLRRSSGLELVSTEEGKAERTISKDIRRMKGGEDFSSKDIKMLRQLELDLSRAIEKLEEARDKLRVRRGY